MTRRRKVVLHTSNGTSIEGFLATHLNHVTLKDAVYLDASQELENDQRTDIPGTVIVLKSNVDWYHRL